MKKRVLISTGGSGGHVVPGTIFYDHLKYEFEMFMTSDHRGIKFLDENKYNTKIVASSVLIPLLTATLGLMVQVLFIDL